MRLLFDNNLSHKLPSLLQEQYPGCAHIRDFGLSRSRDQFIWEFAKENQFVIVSKDVDFQQRAMLYGFPPKVIWLRVGNQGTHAIRTLLISHAPEVLLFLQSQEKALLILG
jgi:predicted nuclease of predicted toxin-antitoxin system